MWERLLIVLALALAGLAGYYVLRLRQQAQVSRVAVQRDRPTLLYFRSDRCAPCLAQGQFVQQVQRQYGEKIVVEKIDADVQQETAARYGVFTLPTTLVVDEAGKVRHANYGLADARKLAVQLSLVE